VINHIDLKALVASDLAPQIDRLVRKADANGDGCVSSSEFSEFLADVLERVQREIAPPPVQPAREQAAPHLPAQPGDVASAASLASVLPSQTTATAQAAFQRLATTRDEK
jgi:hypothetical protein